MSLLELLLVKEDRQRSYDMLVATKKTQDTHILVSDSDHCSSDTDNCSVISKNFSVPVFMSKGI